MPNSNGTVLVVGASGRLAGLIVPALARRAARVRALIRHEKDSAAVRARGAHEVVIGDLRDRESLQAALRDVAGVFHIGPAFEPDEAQLGLNLIDAARTAGVRRFVFSGVIHPTNHRLANHASKQPVEEALFASGMQYTILHPTTLFQNIDSSWAAVCERGEYAEPFSTTVQLARVDYRDVAEIAAIALTEERLAYGTFELCATGLPTSEDIAAVMSEVLGREIKAVRTRFEQWSAAARLPYDEHQLLSLAKVFDYFDQYGSAGNSLVLRTILGHEPRTLRQYIEDLAARRSTTAL